MKTAIYDRGTEMFKDTHPTIYLKSNGGLSSKLLSYTYFSVHKEFSKLKNITQIFSSLSRDIVTHVTLTDQFRVSI